MIYNYYSSRHPACYYGCPQKKIIYKYLSIINYSFWILLNLITLFPKKGNLLNVNVV